MKKINKCSIKETMDVYQFMTLCGLICKKKKGCILSHKAMIRKLDLRSKEYPLEVIVPLSLSFDYVVYEKIKRGEILLVRDDYEQIKPYFRPPIVSKVFLSEEEKEAIRSKLIDEYLEECAKETDQLKPGELRYLERQKKKEDKCKKIGGIK